LLLRKQTNLVKIKETELFLDIFREQVFVQHEVFVEIDAIFLQHFFERILGHNFLILIFLVLEFF
jgi:hypothetical protein